MYFFLCFKNGLTPLEVAESRLDGMEQYDFYRRKFEDVIELLSKHIEETTTYHVSIIIMTVDILAME